MPQVAANRGRQINFINGITGVTPGGQAVVNMPVNQRYHRLNFQCSAINFTGGEDLATEALTGSGTGLLVDVTVVNGVPTAVVVGSSGGTGYADGDTITILDATGQGFVGTVAETGGVVDTVAITSAGIASPINPATLITSMKLLVNGVNMRDIDVIDILKIASANGLQLRLGELPIFFTAPWRNVNQQNELESWDLFGQSTFQLQIAISGVAVSPSLIGTMEFDYMRNARPGPKGEAIPFLQPMAQHSFTWPIVAGRNDINTLPFSYPISRMWFQGSTPGSISQVEIYQDGNKVFEGTLAQLQQSYEEYGFWFGKHNYVFDELTAETPAIVGQYNPLVAYDAAFISDPDQRPWKALNCANSLVVRIYSSVAQNLTIVQETLPGSFQS